jgi:hypothetical protein
MRNRGRSLCRALWIINCFLPDTIPFIHAGFELAEEQPVNLGLAFTPDEVKALSDTPLGLFDLTALHWDQGGLLPLEMGRIASLRAQYGGVAHARGAGSLSWLAPRNGDGSPAEDLVAFVRTDPGSGRTLLILADWRCAGPRSIVVETGLAAVRFEELVTHRVLEAPGGRLELALGSGEGLLLSPA